MALQPSQGTILNVMGQARRIAADAGVVDFDAMRH